VAVDVLVAEQRRRDLSDGQPLVELTQEVIGGQADRLRAGPGLSVGQWVLLE
jgi:hypothetical protein